GGGAGGGRGPRRARDLAGLRGPGGGRARAHPAAARHPGGAALMLVVLEGLDGAGTTTQTSRLIEHLRARGRDAHATREPSDGPIGRLLRAFLAGAHGPVDATTMALLFAADRADHLAREVEPALARGAIVVSDRWY